MTAGSTEFPPGSSPDRAANSYDAAVPDGPVAAPIHDFVGTVAGLVAALSGRPPAAHRSDAAMDAGAIVLSVVNADGRATDDELSAYLDGVGPLLDPPVTLTVAQFRSSRLPDAKRGWVDRPSALFELVVAADARSSTRHAVTYYERAMALAHATAAIDLVPSTEELRTIDRFRSTLLAAFDAAGVPRPGAVMPEPPRIQPDPHPDGSGSTGGPGVTPPAVTTGSAPATAAHPAAVPDGPPDTLDSLLAELDDLVGLAAVKAEVRRLASLIRVQQLREAQQLPTVEISHHLVFTGNPGTGKTTVARLLSRIYKALGVVSKGHLVETDRSALVAGYVGQTANKTAAVLNSGLGGTVLIDEAYSLARGGEQDFGREAVDTLVKFMEDHRDDIAIVAAGYPAEMQSFIDTNPGLKSRFTRTINFADYTVDELVLIFEKLGHKQRYVPSDAALAVVRAVIASEPRDEGFGNARYVRNLFEAAIAHQAARLAPLEEPTVEQLTTLIAEDIVPVDDAPR